jgi:glutamyl/glutaminyl-tRNA synthetase
MKGRKLSKRDGDVEVHSFRAHGYLPEALVNFIALLGWSPGTNQEKMTLAEMVELFSIDRIGRTNARFDRDKLLAFNTDWLNGSSPERLLAGFQDYLRVSESPIGKANLDEAACRELLRVNHGFRTFTDIDHKSGFIFVPDEEIRYDEKAVKDVLAKGDGAGFAMLEKLAEVLANQADWTAGALETQIKAVCEREGVGLGKVAQPLRVAVSGGTISPAIFDTLVLLGKDRTIARIRRALALKSA